LTKSKADHFQGLLLFRLDQAQTFAIGTLKIREIVPYQTLTSLPHSHPAALGAATIRGTTIPVIDMAAAVGYPPLDKKEHAGCFVIITDCQRMEVGFMVRGIDKIIECNWRDVIAPTAALGAKSFITGVTEIEGKLLQLLDVELLLARIFPIPDSMTHPVLTDVQREKIKPMRILLVDDSRVARKQLSDALNNMNIPYQVTDNGQQALDIMIASANEGRPVNILVSDIEMPGLDGYELAFEVRNRADIASAFIILHTSLSSKISVSQAHQVGANEALTKFDANELILTMLKGAEQQTREAAKH
jgi:two-component system, chemotaxis family, chemotaxis protein CheV